jgi:hypothetical protein
MTTVVRPKTLEKLAELSRTDLLWLARKARKELNRRFTSERVRRGAVAGAMQGLANVMAGVAWALACRDSLRRSKGHLPTYGKRPASGEMWLPWELMYALRHEVKERQWSPLGAKTAQDVLRWLAVEHGRKIGRANPAFREGPGGIEAVTAFRVPFASETAALHIDLAALEQRH